MKPTNFLPEIVIVVVSTIALCVVYFFGYRPLMEPIEYHNIIFGGVSDEDELPYQVSEIRLNYFSGINDDEFIFDLTPSADCEITLGNHLRLAVSGADALVKIQSGDNFQISTVKANDFVFSPISCEDDVSISVKGRFVQELSNIVIFRSRIQLHANIIQQDLEPLLSVQNFAQLENVNVTDASNKIQEGAKKYDPQAINFRGRWEFPLPDSEITEFAASGRGRFLFEVSMSGVQEASKLRSEGMLYILGLIAGVFTSIFASGVYEMLRKLFRQSEDRP